jgi:RNA polymerase sigma-70 factor (ECF subfamily)
VDRLLRLVPWPVAPPERDPADDERLVAGLRGGEGWAPAALVERHGPHIRRVLIRLLGADDGDAADLLQEVLVRALAGVHGVEDARALKAWITRIAVFTARAAIRRRRRRRWLVLFADVPDRPTAWAGPELAEAAGAVYRIFDRMPTDERIPFALRVLDGMDLQQTAAACAMSVATVRRRLARAERRFFKLAGEYEALRPWLPASRVVPAGSARRHSPRGVKGPFEGPSDGRGER